MNRIGWHDPKPGETIPNMYTIKNQPVFIRPEQYKESMDLSLMLAWNAQITFGHRAPRLPQEEVFKINKLRGPGVGTGDALWKEAARVDARKQLADYEKDRRIGALQAEVDRLRAPAPLVPEQKPPKNYGIRESLNVADIPIAALQPNRCGSPGTFGVKNQVGGTDLFLIGWQQFSHFTLFFVCYRS